MDSRIETYKHKADVHRYLSIVIEELNRRALNHDNSKLESPEVEYFDKYTEQLKSLNYGTEEYEECRNNIKPALDHHYSNNSHHPEFGDINAEWKDIKDYEGIYQVSSVGLVRCVRKDNLNRKLGLTPRGYLRVQLSKNGKTKNHLAHRLVADAFIVNESPETRNQINHKNGIKTDNRVENLEWVTPSENLIHAYDNGLRTSNAKYLVHCDTLNITTIGSVKMEQKLKELGYDKADAAAIWNCINLNSDVHLGLEFTGLLLAEYTMPNSLSRMTLMDLMEMMADWTAATKRTKNGDIRRSIELNQERFGYPDDLKQVLLNSIDCFEHKS